MPQVDNSVKLPCHLYVYEGSTLPNNMLRADISQILHSDQVNGCNTYSSCRDKVSTHVGLLQTHNA
jgi:hypothetical protein